MGLKSWLLGYAKKKMLDYYMSRQDDIKKFIQDSIKGDINAAIDAWSTKSKPGDLVKGVVTTFANEAGDFLSDEMYKHIDSWIRREFGDGQ